MGRSPAQHPASARRPARPRCRPRRRRGRSSRRRCNGPDEVAHFAYAEYLAENRPRAQRRGRHGHHVDRSAATALFGLNLQPILLHPEGKPTFSAIDRVEAQLAKLPAAAPQERRRARTPAANYPPLYYAYEAVAYQLSPLRSLLGRLFFMRLGDDAAVRRDGVADVADRRRAAGARRGRARWPPGSSRCSPSSASAAGSSTPT